MEKVEKIQPDEVIEPEEAQSQPAPGGRGPRRPFAWSNVSRICFFALGMATANLFAFPNLISLLAFLAMGYLTWREGTSEPKV